MVRNSNKGNTIGEVVVLESVSKVIGDKRILDSVSFSVNKGEIFSLIGPNGAGKTTTMRIILGLLTPTSGKVKLFGNDRINFKDYLKMISAVLEESILWEKFSGTQNILMFSNLLGLDQKLVFKKALEYAQLLHIEKALQTPVHTYSKGMKRKLSLILGLIKDPDLFILDEPNSGIDPESKVDIRNILLMLKQKGKTICLTSHDLDEVQRIADHTAIINKGKIVVSGETEKLGLTSNTKIVVIKPDGSEFSQIFKLLPKDGVSYSIDSNKLIITTSKEDSVQEIVKIILDKGYKLQEVIEEKSSLEDIYMEILKEEGH